MSHTHSHPALAGQGRIVLLVMLIGVAAVSIASFAFTLYSIDLSSCHGGKMSRLERSMADLRAAMNGDAIRQQNIQKVTAIIERYNPRMTSSDKYDIANEIYNMSIKYPNLNVDLICATITHESALTWRPDVKSTAGAMGLMQLMPATGVFLSAYEGITWTSPEDILYNPIYNIRLGCRYLSTLIGTYDLKGGLAAYNGGPRSAALWLASGRNDRMLSGETRGYVPAVLKLYEEFRH